MLNIVKNTLLQLLRKPMNLVWSLAFPLVMVTLGHLMFTSITNSVATHQVLVAFVEDATWKESPVARSLESLQSTTSNGSPLLKAKAFSTAADAQKALKNAEVEGVFEVGQDGLPKLTLAPIDSKAHLDAFGSSMYPTDYNILQSINNAYVQAQALLDTIAQTNPQALSDPDAVTRALNLNANSEITQLTRVTPDPFMRYYYAWLALSVLMYANQALYCLRNCMPSFGAVGTRYATSATKKTSLLLGTLIGCWISFAILICITVIWMYFGLSINFGGREGLCLVGLAGALFLPLALGSLVTVLPIKNTDWAGNILVIITMVSCMFSGAFGEPSMELANTISNAFPVLGYLNPASLIVNLLTSLYYYDSLAPFFTYLAACFVWAAGACALAIFCFRRSSYAN